MRVDQLTVGPAHDPAEIRFHPRLTVIGGMEVAARAEFANLLFAALSGSGDELRGARWVDSTGLTITGRTHGGGWRWSTDDGAPWHDPATVLGLDERSLRRLMLLSAADLTPPPLGPVTDETPELTEARATLAALEAELADGVAVQRKVDVLRSEIAEIDEQLRSAESDGARRRYATLAAQLERVRLEAASLRGGATVAEADRRFIAAAADIRALADRWRRSRIALRSERQRWGDRERLDARTLAEALATPEDVPPELDALAAAYEAAEAKRALLAERLQLLATGALPQPSHPAVVRLAHAGQEEVWSAARRAVAAEEHLEDQSLALGGLQAEGVSPTAASDLETAHDAVDVAERELHRRRLPGLGGALASLLVALVGVITTPILILLGFAAIGGTAVWAIAIPSRELARRRQEEADALQKAGVASYITFQMRRLEVNIDPKATEPLELAALEYRRAIAGWRKLAGDLAPQEALGLEAETRAYTTALSGSRGAADEIAHVRHQLADEVEPAVDRARAKLIAACAPFGIDDPRLAVDLVRYQAGIGGVARQQAAVEAAESAETDARLDIDYRLSTLGFGGGTDEPSVERRLDAFERAREDAEARELARTSARPAQEVEADLARLEALVNAHRRPEWGDIDVDKIAIEIDVERLSARRTTAVAEYETAYRGLVDIERLTDRREALVRRVAVLAVGKPEDEVDSADLQQVLLARLAAARRVGAFGESVTVVLDEPFERIHGEHKWIILDAVERLSASVQLVYLTDDVEVLVWARRRSPAGNVSLLEPARDAV